MAITIGTRLGSYEITDFLGNVVMGEVYRSRNSTPKRIGFQQCCY